MRQITMDGFAYCKPAESWEHTQSNVADGFAYHFVHCSFKGIGGYIDAGTATMTITLPDNFDPRQGAVEALSAQKKKIIAEFQARIIEIDRQIGKFTAIEYAGSNE